MEVHHHPDLHHRKKNIREYLLEFLMIFLAVTMGFFAENIRESVTENSRAKEYAHALYDDLKGDTATLNFQINFKRWRGRKIDSLIAILKSGNLKNNQKRIYYLNAFLRLNIPFRPSDVAIQQLRNTGGLRYFKNPKLYKSITEYYNFCDFYYDREKQNTVPVPANLSAKLFRSDVLIAEENIVPDIMNSIKTPEGEPKLVTMDKQTWNEYLMYVGTERRANNLTIFLLQDRIKALLKDSMTELQKEFDLD